MTVAELDRLEGLLVRFALAREVEHVGAVVEQVRRERRKAERAEAR